MWCCFSWELELNNEKEPVLGLHSSHGSNVYPFIQWSTTNLAALASMLPSMCTILYIKSHPLCFNVKCEPRILGILMELMLVVQMYRLLSTLSTLTSYLKGCRPSDRLKMCNESLESIHIVYFLMKFYLIHAK